MLPFNPGTINNAWTDHICPNSCCI